MNIGERIKNVFKKFGPGWITGAADDDPSGIGTYSYSGSRFGLGQIWTMLFTFPLMASVQELCARIGQVTGKGLARVMVQNFSKRIAFLAVFLLLVANIFNIGADIGIMAASMKLLLPGPFIFWAVFFTFVSLALEIFVSYKNYAKYLKWLTFSLFAYVITAFIVRPDWLAVIQNVTIPHIEFNRDFVFALVGVFGTTISPYLFFWQASEEVEEEVAIGRTTVSLRQGASTEEINTMRLDVVVGMFFSNIVAFFIILTTASTLFKNGIVVNSAQEAAMALAPIAGPFASLIFTIGIIATGLLAIPVLAGSASYALSELLGWKEGLNNKLEDAKGFYFIIFIATALGLLINMFGLDPVKALVWAAVLNGMIAPILLTFIIKVGNNKVIMGKWVSGRLSNTLCWITTGLMGITAILLIIFSVFI